MALDFTLVLRAETAAAKAELEATARGIKGVAVETEKATGKTKASESAARAEAAARRAQAAAARELTTANRSAAGATGNLVAQFNDIGVMLAAGQNPLQLAIQQGPQITQAFGNAGAAGAVKLLGAAFVQMLNPLNLITFGVIAASGVMIQWLTSAGSESAAVTAEFERQQAAIEGIVAETEKLRLARGMMLSGAETENEQVLLEENNRLLTERAAIDERLANQSAFIGNARAVALQAELEARRAAINVEIGANNERLVGLQKQRELNAETAAAVDLAGRVRTATAGIAAALQAADGSRLVAAFGAAFPMASQLLGMAQGIIATIGQAQAQAAAMQSAETAGLASQYAQYGAGRVAGEQLVRSTGPLYGGNGRINIGGVTPVRGAGGGAAARDEADALQELITSLEAEIEALRVQDPIQQEMLKYREALAGATEAERQKVEDLIATREREQLLMEGVKARTEFFEEIGTNALDALITKGASFNDVLKDIINSLIKAALQGAIFGEGPFGSLFGGKSILSGLFGGGGGGGGLGSLLGGGDLFGGLASGGMVHGPGTGTSDSIPTLLSNGEYVVNARATSRNRHLLEAINSGGRINGYAEGGYVGSDSRRQAGRSGRDLPAQIYMDLRGVKGDREIEAVARRSAAQMIALYDKEGLPVSVKRVSGDPRRTG